MKPKLVVFSLLIVVFWSCNNTENQSTMKTNSESHSELKGTWELVGFYNFKDNVIVDSFKANPNFRQLKMYTDTKVMWCKHLPADSSEWFGYGTYKFKNDTLSEVLDFGSAVMDEVIAEKKKFRFEITLTENRFEQIELDEEGNRIYSENYKRIEK